METHRFIVPTEARSQRLDKFLAAALPSLSRSRIQALLAGGHLQERPAGITIIDPSVKVKPGQEFELTLPPAEPAELAAQSIPLSIIYEDDDLLVIDKPAGLTVHPAPGHADGTLVNALLAHCGDSLSGIGGVSRPGIVHRIDKDTSGLLVVAKHDAAHRALSAQLADRSLSRIYLAVVWGAPRPLRGTIEGNIGRSPTHRKKMAVLKQGGKPAVTHYETLEPFPASDTPLASLLRCKLETGRTHQIRVHLASRGHPLIGDATYGAGRRQASGNDTLLNNIRKFHRQALHAASMEFIHPRSGKAMTFDAPLPQDLESLLLSLRELK